MKKIMQVILAIAVLCCSAPFCAHADGAIDSGVLNFDGVTDAAGIETALKAPGYLLEAAFGNTDDKNTIAPAESDAEFGTSIAMHREDRNTGLTVMSVGNDNWITDDLVFEFSIKKGSTASSFGCGLRTNGNDASYIFAFRNNGYVQLCGKDMVQYDADTWYDVKLEYHPEKSYALLYLKKHGEENYNTYRSVFAKDYWGIQQKNLTDGYTKIEIGYLGGEPETAYIDNIRYYTTNIGTVTLISDDFSSVPETVTDNSAVTDYTKQWRLYGGDKCTLETAQVDGKNVLAINAQGGWVTIGKLINELQLPEDTTSIVKFGIGRNDENASVFFSLDVDGSNVKQVFYFQKDAPKLAGTDYYNAATGKILNFEYVYNKKQGISRVLTPASGTGRYFGNDVNAVLSGSIDFQIAAGDNPTTVYLSDFAYDALDDNKCKLLNASLLSGNAGASAALDDQIIFEFNQPIVLTNNVSSNGWDIECILKDAENNEIKCVVYPSQTEPNKLTAIPQEMLKPGTEYTVTLPKVQGGYDSEITADTSYTFTTADFKYEFGQPIMEDNTIKVNAKSAYISGKNAVIVAAAYDASGRLTGFDSMPVSATKADGETFVFTPEFKAPYTTVKAFVWSDLENIKPYAKNYSN